MSVVSSTEQELIDQVLTQVGSIRLSIDELVTLSSDLDLTEPLGGDLGIPSGTIEQEGARRSLLSKQFLVEGQGGGLELQPWFTLLADAVAEPLLVVRMRRAYLDHYFEWTVFLDGRLGVQQQVGSDGIVTWAPFGAEQLVDIMFDALEVGHTSDPQFGSFASTIGELTEWESADPDLMHDSIAAEEYCRGLRSPQRTTSMVVVIDKTAGDIASSRDLAWLNLGDEGCWLLRCQDEGVPQASSSVDVERVGSRRLAEEVLSLLPLDASEVMRLAARAR